MEGDFNVIDVSNAFSNIGDSQVLSYINGKNRNRYGIDEPTYLVKNSDGTVIRYENYNDLLQNSGLVENADPFGFSPVEMQINPYSPIKGAEYATYQEFGNDGQKNTVLVGRDGYLYLYKGEDAKPRRIFDIEKLKNILATNMYTNKDLDLITQRPGQIWTDPMAAFR